MLIDERLLRDLKPQTERAIVLLQGQLRDIASRVPPRAVARLREVTLWMSPKIPDRTPRAEYHPSADWLSQHGRDPAKAKGVEFTNIEIFEQEVKRMPVFVLHELAHAYHDQVLGFDQPANQGCLRSGRGQQVVRRDPALQWQDRTRLRHDQCPGVLRRNERGLFR